LSLLESVKVYLTQENDEGLYDNEIALKIEDAKTYLLSAGIIEQLETDEFYKTYCVAIAKHINVNTDPEPRNKELNEQSLEHTVKNLKIVLRVY
jgi:hypothetical protein